MKIAICSDLHLEFARLDLRNTQNADVLILSGDIIVAEDIRRHREDKADDTSIAKNIRYVNSTVYRDFLSQVNSEFKRVLWVAGNHEFYGGKWSQTLDVCREISAEYSNIFFMENDSIIFNDVLFIGSTLWTNMNSGDPITLQVVKGMMNDYRKITNDEEGYRKLLPSDTVFRHKRSLEYIERAMAGTAGLPVVVIGHHAPCKLSTKPEYANDYCMNGAYSSDLSNFILDNPRIKCWTHGHTHDKYDYMVGSTRIVCNPRGYAGYQDIAEDFQLQYIEI